jgi:hypothetical protein
MKPNIPLNVDPITTVLPDEAEQHNLAFKKEKSKKKKSIKSNEKKMSSSTSVKKTPKPKRSE